MMKINCFGRLKQVLSRLRAKKVGPIIGQTENQAGNSRVDYNNSDEFYQNVTNVLRNGDCQWSRAGVQGSGNVSGPKVRLQMKRAGEDRENGGAAVDQRREARRA